MMTAFLKNVFVNPICKLVPNLIMVLVKVAMANINLANARQITKLVVAELQPELLLAVGEVPLNILHVKLAVLILVRHIQYHLRHLVLMAQLVVMILAMEELGINAIPLHHQAHLHQVLLHQVLLQVAALVLQAVAEVLVDNAPLDSTIGDLVLLPTSLVVVEEECVDVIHWEEWIKAVIFLGLHQTTSVHLTLVVYSQLYINTLYNKYSSSNQNFYFGIAFFKKSGSSFSAEAPAALA